MSIAGYLTLIILFLIIILAFIGTFTLMYYLKVKKAKQKLANINNPKKKKPKKKKINKIVYSKRKIDQILHFVVLLLSKKKKYSIEEIEEYLNKLANIDNINDFILEINHGPLEGEIFIYKRFQKKKFK